MKAYAPLLLAGVVLSPLSALAGPADYVATPTVEYGEREIDFKAGTARKGDNPRESAASIGFGYGAKDWWFTELYLKYKREDSQGTKYDAIEWENKFQLTDTGKYPVDIGFIVELERPRNRAEGWEVMWGPLFQTEFSKFQLNANILFERSYRVEERSDMHFLYQWQTKYRWRPQLEFGLQGFGDMGKWNHWATKDERSHSAGPAVFGKLPIGNHQAIKYNAAWLVGTSNAAPDHTLRMQVEFEF
jgi:hypothetical protein